jgi:alpha-glucosidase
LSNHDTPRHRSRYGGSEERARAAAIALLTLRGTPFLYAGEELGLLDAEIPDERRVDPGGRDGCRAPLPWTARPDHGWPASPWLPWPPEADDRNVARQREDTSSIAHLYRQMLELRAESAALSAGSWHRLLAPTEVLAYERRHDDDRMLVAVNFGDHGVDGVLVGHAISPARQQHAPFTVEISSRRGGRGGRWDGHLDANEAVVLSLRSAALTTAGANADASRAASGSQSPRA